MKTSKFLGVGVFFLVIFLPSVGRAQVYINEFMYDLSGTDTGREWVEIYNAGSSSVDLTEWKFLEKPSASNHGINAVQGNTLINPGEFAVIALDLDAFLADWPDYSGNLFRSSFSSLNNTGSTLILKDENLSVVDQVVYDSSLGASGDSGSLQRQSDSSWMGAEPTPGLTNSSTPISSGTNNPPPSDNNSTTTATTTSQTTNDTGVLSSHSSPAGISNFAYIETLKISAGRNRLATAATEVEFKAEANRGRSVSYSWNFGDGYTAIGEEVLHVYEYPGTYIVILNAVSRGKQAVSRTTVKVVKPELEVSRADSESISIRNNSKYETNLTNWAIRADDRMFEFPPDTIIAAGETISLSSTLTHLSPSDATTVVLKPLTARGKPVPEVLHEGAVESSEAEEFTMTEAEIVAKIDELKAQIAMLEAQEVQEEREVQQAKQSLIASPIKALDSITDNNSTTTATTTPRDLGWFDKFKRFILGKK